MKKSIFLTTLLFLITYSFDSISQTKEILLLTAENNLKKELNNPKSYQRINFRFIEFNKKESLKYDLKETEKKIKEIEEEIPIFESVLLYDSLFRKAKNYYEDSYGYDYDSKERYGSFEWVIRNEAHRIRNGKTHHLDSLYYGIDLKADYEIYEKYRKYRKYSWYEDYSPSPFWFTHIFPFHPDSITKFKKELTNFKQELYVKKYQLINEIEKTKESKIEHTIVVITFRTTNKYGGLVQSYYEEWFPNNKTINTTSHYCYDDGVFSYDWKCDKNLLRLYEINAKSFGYTYEKYRFLVSNKF